jgi:hypothetical protein
MLSARAVFQLSLYRLAGTGARTAPTHWWPLKHAQRLGPSQVMTRCCGADEPSPTRPERRAALPGCLHDGHPVRARVLHLPRRERGPCPRRRQRVLALPQDHRAGSAPRAPGKSTFVKAAAAASTIRRGEIRFDAESRPAQPGAGLAARRVGVGQQDVYLCRTPRSTTTSPTAGPEARAPEVIRGRRARPDAHIRPSSARCRRVYEIAPRASGGRRALRRPGAAHRAGARHPGPRPSC